MFILNFILEQMAQYIKSVSVAHKNFYVYLTQWRARGEGGGARAPVPLRSDAKVLKGLCDMNDKNQYCHSLYAEYTVCLGHQLVGGHHPSCSKKTTTKKCEPFPHPHPRPLTLHVRG